MAEEWEEQEPRGVHVLRAAAAEGAGGEASELARPPKEFGFPLKEQLG